MSLSTPTKQAQIRAALEQLEHRQHALQVQLGAVEASITHLHIRLAGLSNGPWAMGREQWAMGCGDPDGDHHLVEDSSAEDSPTPTPSQLQLRAES